MSDGQRTRAPAGSDHGEPGCVTCGDVASPMRVLAVDTADGLALCLDAHERRVSVDTGILDAVAPGEVLLVHAGTALARVSA